jgi:hypothetical protein
MIETQYKTNDFPKNQETQKMNNAPSAFYTATLGHFNLNGHTKVYGPILSKKPKKHCSNVSCAVLATIILLPQKQLFGQHQPFCCCDKERFKIACGAPT